MGTPHLGAAQGCGEPLVPQSCSESNPHTHSVLSPGKGAKRGAPPRGAGTPEAGAPSSPLSAWWLGLRTQRLAPELLFGGWFGTLLPSLFPTGPRSGQAGREKEERAAPLSRDVPPRAKNSKSLARFRDPPAPIPRTPPVHTRTCAHTRESLAVTEYRK